MSVHEAYRPILHELLQQEGIELTRDQTEALDVFLRFFSDPNPDAVLILRGAAGTGKTFLIRLLSRFLTRQGWKSALLAPTGRAAKVITRRSKRYASTLHRYIYMPVEQGGSVSFLLKENKDPQKMCYIVDEASMLGDGEGSGVLSDFLQFAFAESRMRKVIMVGDPAQLPPVGSQVSPALDRAYLVEHFHVTAFDTEMTEVMRQEVDSDILVWASEFRAAMVEGRAPVVERMYRSDVEVLDDANEALETYTGLYRDDDPDRVLFITYSNKFATDVNRAIRQRLFDAEEELIAGEILMVVRNNYAWGNEKFPFIANGEMGVVNAVHRETLEERYGMRWVDVTMEFQNLADEAVEIDCKIVLDLLLTKDAQLPYAVMQALVAERRNALADLPPSRRSAAMRKDPYVNALQVKYGYAVTGHKAQGGQWKNVIVGFEPLYQGMDLSDYLRWTYTALTRAEEKVFALGCPFVPRDF
jgi:exodeoxyribonuclease-5